MTEEPEKDLGGRPEIEIDDDICAKAESLAAQGLNMEQIALVLGIGERTFYEKKKKFPQLSQSLASGKAKGIAVQVNSLFQRGKGYSHPEEKIFCNKDGEITRVQTTKHYPPDTGAAMAWLSNKDPDNWSIRKDVKHSGNVTHKHEGISRTLEILREFRGIRPSESAERALQN